MDGWPRRAELAGVAKLEAAPDLGAGGGALGKGSASRAGSNPATCIIIDGILKTVNAEYEFGRCY